MSSTRYQSDPPGFISIELIAREQVALAIAPTGFTNEADGCATFARLKEASNDIIALEGIKTVVGPDGGTSIGVGWLV